MSNELGITKMKSGTKLVIIIRKGLEDIDSYRGLCVSVVLIR